MRRAAAFLLVASCGGGELDQIASPASPAGSTPASGPAACALPHAASTRRGATCALVACDDGFADCDGDVRNGCEASLRSSTSSCGACDNACSVCDRGACSTLTDVASDGDARELVANGSTLAWLYDDRLRVLTSGSVATWAAGLPAAGEESEAGAIALGDGFAVVADRAGRRLVRVDPVAVTTLAPGAFASVVVRDGVAYALRLAAEEPGAIVRVPLDGAAQTTLAGGLSVTHGCRIAVDDARVWWTDPDAAIVWRVDVGGGPPQPWATRQRMACGVVVDDARAYWIAVDPTLAVFLVRVAKGATPDPDWIQTTTEVGQYSPGKPAWDLALAGGTVWVANHHDGALWRISTASGERSLAAGAQSIRGVAAGDVVAWATRAGVVGMVP